MNWIVIGLGAGLVKARDHVLNEEYGPQGAMDVLATWMGQEVAKELINQKKIKPHTDRHHLLEKLLHEVQIAEDLAITFEDNNAHIVVQNCLICPHRVGGYDLEGYTASPVGEMVRGATNVISGRSPQLTRVDLRTAEICQIDFDFN